MIVARGLGGRVRDALGLWGMRVCLYEGWCTAEGVESSIRSVVRLVRDITNRIKTYKT